MCSENNGAKVATQRDVTQQVATMFANRSMYVGSVTKVLLLTVLLTVNLCLRI